MAREAIFNILADRVPGCEFLDLYAGTGAVGLEAISRGARTVTLVENDREALVLLQKNLELVTRSSDCRLRTASVPNQCARFATETRKFDLIFVDPPYEECGIGIRLLEPILAPDGVLMHQRPVRKTVGDPFLGTTLERYDRRTYGKTEISFWAHPENPIADDSDS
jgi:16S rRNA (guanine966-N2)-methyltransferase